MSSSLIDLPHDQFEQFLDLSGDIVYQTDRSGRITYVNARVTDLLGYTPESLLGSHYLVLVDPSARAETFRFYSEQARQETTRTYHEFPAVARDGARVWVQQHVQLLYDDGKLKGFHGVVRDVSRLQKVEQDLEARDARMELLGQLAAGTGSQTDRIDEGLSAAAELLGLSTAILSRINGDRYEVVQYWPEDAGIHEGQQFDLGATYCDLVLRQEGVVAIEHMGESPHAAHPCYEAFGLQAYIGAPVHVGGRIVGTINFSDPQPRKAGFTGADTGFVLLLARWVGSVLEQSIALDRIQSAEGQLRRVVSASADGVTTCAPNGRILWMNRAACDMLGISQEPVGQDIRLFIPSYFQNPGTSGPEHRQAIQYGGTPFEIELTITRTEHAGGSVVAGIFRDVSARNLQATKLRRREAALRAFFDGTPFLMGILSLRGDELVHLSANAAAIDFLGLLVPPSLLRDGESTENLPDLTAWKQACLRCAAERKPVRLEMQFDGRWLNVTINRIEDPTEDEARFSYVAEDVTTAHHQAVELAKRTAEFEAIYASIPHGAVFANADHGIVAVNPAFQTMFGYTEAEALSLDAAFLFPDGSPGGTETPREITYHRSDGRGFKAETIQVPVPGPDGNRLGWLALIRDVTERNTNRERLSMQAN
ncbi:MAG: PAS domain S-box protein, partial [Rhodothermales bacterium]|nr:PAS domain S-box protein [Rhodothermales bacterium]